jgi:hypothetical protein
MSKAEQQGDDLRSEYRREDFGEMERGRYAARMSLGSNVIVLDPEVAEVFPTADAVNDALRSLISIARTATRQGA